MRSRYIVHVDMDAFFAAIEQRDNPLLRGKPVIVGADPQNGKGRGVVSTCSYEARRYGVASAMPISRAYRRCPHAVFLRPDMEKYHRVSEQIYKIFYAVTPVVEPVSIDEAFLDITGSYHLFGTPLEACCFLKDKIKKEIRLTASVGLAPTKIAAKIASDIKKPDGLWEVKGENLLSFLWELPVERLWGLGKKTKDILQEAGIRSIGDLAQSEKKTLISLLGKNGDYFWHLAWGEDESVVGGERGTKSISNEYTFPHDTAQDAVIESVLLGLCEKVCRRLRQEETKGKTITLKIRLEGFATYTRAATMQKATHFEEEVYAIIKKLYRNFPRRGRKVRLVGVKVSNLVRGDFPQSIFIDREESKKENIHKVIDTIKERFGESAIHRAGSQGYSKNG